MLNKHLQITDKTYPPAWEWGGGWELQPLTVKSSHVIKCHNEHWPSTDPLVCKSSRKKPWVLEPGMSGVSTGQVHKILVRKSQGKRPYGGPRHKMWMWGLYGSDLVYSTNTGFCKDSNEHLYSLTAVNFLTGWMIINFSRKPLNHAVSKV